MLGNHIGGLWDALFLSTAFCTYIPSSLICGPTLWPGWAEVSCNRRGSSERLCGEENSCLLCVAPRSVFEQTMHASGQLSELCYSSALLHDPHLALETVDLSALDGDSGASVHTSNSVCRSTPLLPPAKNLSHSTCLWTHPSFSKTSFFLAFDIKFGIILR